MAPSMSCCFALVTLLLACTTADAARLLKADSHQASPTIAGTTRQQLRGSSSSSSSSSSSRKLLDSWSYSSSNHFNHANAATLLAEDATEQAIDEAASGDSSAAWAARTGQETSHLATLANQGDRFALDVLEQAGGKRRMLSGSGGDSSNSWRSKITDAVQRTNSIVSESMDAMSAQDDTAVDDKRKLLSITSSGDSSSSWRSKITDAVQRTSSIVSESMDAMSAQDDTAVDDK